MAAIKRIHPPLSARGNATAVTAASHSAVQNCTVRATTTAAVLCQGAVDSDIENCELLAI